MIALLASLALAADIDRYPWQAPVEAPATESGEVLRVAVPPQMRTVADPLDGSDLLLVDATGAVIPVAVARGTSSQQQVQIVTRRTEDPNVFEIEASDREIDGLLVNLPTSYWAVTVSVERRDGGRWVDHGEPVLLWRHSDSERREILLPASADSLRVHLRHHEREPTGEPEFTGIRRPRPQVESSSLRLPVTDTRVREDGWVRYTVPLPHALPAREVSLHVDDELFERGVTTTDRPHEDQDFDTWVAPIYASSTVQRVRFGGASLEQVTVPVSAGLSTDQLLIYVESSGRPPLSIHHVTLTLDGLELLAPEPGTGPWTLYGGARPSSSSPSDLNVAVPELMRAAPVAAVVGEVAVNPGYVPIEVRAGLEQAGTSISVQDFAYRHAVQGEAGLVRIPLPREVLSGARRDLADLRVVDPQDQQIPYLLRRLPEENWWKQLPAERTEDGSLSRLRVSLPDPNVTVSAVSLHTDVPLFSRVVTLSRVRGAELEPLRSVQWIGSERPSTLSLDIGEVVGEELVITIDNGDNPPLDLDPVDVAWPAWEVVTYLPAGGASLYYGDHHTTWPSYDLSLLEAEVFQRTSTQATLGPAVALDPPAPSPWDRAVLLLGVVVLVMGLGGLTISLILAVPEGKEPPKPSAKEPPGPAGEEQPTPA